MAKFREDFSYRLSRLSRLWRKTLDERLKDLGLTQSRWVTLLYIQRLGGDLTQRELANALAIESPTLARFMDSLEKDQLIIRVSCPSDGRAKRVNLTSQGMDYLQALNQRAAGLREQLLGDISDADLQTCFRVFDQITKNAQRLSANPACEGRTQETGSQEPDVKEASAQDNPSLSAAGTEAVNSVSKVNGDD